MKITSPRENIKEEKMKEWRERKGKLCARQKTQGKVIKTNYLERSRGKIGRKNRKKFWEV